MRLGSGRGHPVDRAARARALSPPTPGSTIGPDFTERFKLTHPGVAHEPEGWRRCNSEEGRYFDHLFRRGQGRWRDAWGLDGRQSDRRTSLGDRHGGDYKGYRPRDRSGRPTFFKLDTTLEAAMAKTLDERVEELEKKVRQLDGYVVGLIEDLSKLRDDLEDHADKPDHLN